MKRLMMTTMLCLFVLGALAIGGDLTKPSLNIEGTKLSSEAEAKRFARDSYTKKMGPRLMAEEGVRHITVITLGYEVPDFAKRGEKIWEARIMAFFDRDLRAIIWINPRTEQVHFVCGPWEEKAAE